MADDLQPDPTPAPVLAAPPPPASLPMDAIVLPDSPFQTAYSYRPFPGYAQYPYWLIPPPPKEKVYSVPRRFGMSALLAIITGQGCLFGLLRFLDAPPVVYLMIGTQVMVICLVQMFFGDVPRRASVIAGMVLLPVFTLMGLCPSLGSDIGNN